MKIIFLLICFFLGLFSNAQNKTHNYIEKYKDLAILEMNRYGIPASITLAQAILESGNGESRLAVHANNHFGIKCHNNWQGNVIYEDDDEKNECFRKYTKVSDSYRDRSLFLSNRDRYSFLFEYKLTHYKKWAKGLRKAGYATNPKYHRLLINLIDKYDLSRFDMNNDSTNKLYLSYSYGAPYLMGIGIYYFKNRSLYFSEINTSLFLSSVSIVGYSYEIFNNSYLGINFGFIRYLHEIFDNRYTSVPFISAEKVFDFRKKNKPFLVKIGAQLPFNRIEITESGVGLVPYLKINYFFN